MAELFNIYCDESCHLEHDQIPFMVLGCIWCKAERTLAISRRIREIKQKHGLLKPEDLQAPDGRPFETKWTKVSKAKLDFYLNLVDYFFDDDHLHFRCVLIDKRILNHGDFAQTHDDWYYKILFTLLEPIIDPEQRYRVYLDIKDTRSEQKRAKLEEVLRNARHDHYQQIVERVQQVRSHESELIQMCDLLMGAVVYHNRMRAGDLPKAGVTINAAKVEVIRRIQRRSAKSLEVSTWLREPKFNILRWQPREVGL